MAQLTQQNRLDFVAMTLKHGLTDDGLSKHRKSAHANALVLADVKLGETYFLHDTMGVRQFALKEIKTGRADITFTPSNYSASILLTDIGLIPYNNGFWSSNFITANGQ